MIKEVIKILHWLSGKVLFEAEIEYEGEVTSQFKLGLAVNVAVSSGANLDGANLDGANLDGANLRGAYLRGAYLRGAYLRGAYLDGAYLDGANLDGANLRGANLDGANLRGAYLDGAYLRGAYLRGANLGGGITISKTPLQILGLTWPVTIFDQHMRIGCQFHSLHDWENFDDYTIRSMSPGTSLPFWQTNKDVILCLARAHGRSFEPFVAPEPETAPTEAQEA
ncbi:pentapeptide repeat-containing protein [Asticcacaulis sp.]|uniref:pentapeptide repeat-containing protein n=1 Tax=Asticcacaulis sp. TaxID=1872648 RepID=UPI0031D0B42E